MYPGWVFVQVELQSVRQSTNPAQGESEEFLIQGDGWRFIYPSTVGVVFKRNREMDEV
jgi:hypothetical protein